MAVLFDLLDESTRPKAPAIPGATPAHRVHGQRLALFHEMHLAQIERIEALLAAIEAGAAPPEALGARLRDLDMASNYRLFGSLCGRECQYLTFHHTGEDEQIFPVLMQGSAGLRAVVERLSEEHKVIHAILEELEAGAAALIASPDAEAFGRVRDAFVVLARVVRSHFGYEQTELAEALGVYRIPL